MPTTELLEFGLAGFMLVLTAIVTVFARMIASNIKCHNEKLKNSVTKMEMERYVNNEIKYVNNEIKVAQLNIKNEIDVLSAKFNFFNEKLDALDRNFGKFEVTTSNMYTDVNRFVQKADAVFQEKVNNVEKNVDRIDKNVEKISKSVSQLTVKIASMP